MRGRRVRQGVDALLARPDRYAPRGRVALLANQASTTAEGRPTIDALREAPEVKLVALLSPEHGWSGFEEDARAVMDRVDTRTGLPVHSLYGPRRRPGPELLRELDAVIVDVQEVGVRPYTYAATVAMLLEAAAESGTRVVVCDRPNLLGPHACGPPLADRLRSFLAYLPVPYQHGLTLGELARLHAGTALAGRVDLEVVPLADGRDGGSSQYGWIPPSPGLPTREAMLLYPGLVLLEGVNASEGRGTSLPFQLLGAPWLEGYGLAEELNEMGLPGLWARPLSFLPESGRFAGRACHGVHLHVTDPGALTAFESAIRILMHLRATRPAFGWLDAADMPWSREPEAGRPWHEPAHGPLIDGLTGSEEVRAVIEGRLGLLPTARRWREQAQAFLRAADRYLLYAPPLADPKSVRDLPA